MLGYIMNGTSLPTTKASPLPHLVIRLWNFSHIFGGHYSGRFFNLFPEFSYLVFRNPLPDDVSVSKERTDALQLHSGLLQHLSVRQCLCQCHNPMLRHKVAAALICSNTVWIIVGWSHQSSSRGG